MILVSLFKGTGGAYGQAALLKKQAEMRKQQAEARTTPTSVSPAGASSVKKT